MYVSIFVVLKNYQVVYSRRDLVSVAIDVFQHCIVLLVAQRTGSIELFLLCVQCLSHVLDVWIFWYCVVEPCTVVHVCCVNLHCLTV